MAWEKLDMSGVNYYRYYINGDFQRKPLLSKTQETLDGSKWTASNLINQIWDYFDRDGYCRIESYNREDYIQFNSKPYYTSYSCSCDSYISHFHVHPTNNTKSEIDNNESITKIFIQWTSNASTDCMRKYTDTQMNIKFTPPNTFASPILVYCDGSIVMWGYHTSYPDVIKNSQLQAILIRGLELSNLDYTITVTESDYGTVTVDKVEAAENETVRVTVKPNLGQKLYRLYVVGDNTGSVSVTTESENVYSFTMPADNVKVSAVFMSNDAYVPAGEDAEDLGGGDYSDISDPVPVPSVPSISASNIGMVTLFRPSLQNILDLGQYLYTDWWELGDNLKKWLSNPIEAMIGFNIVPCIPAVGTDRVVKLGIVSTGVSMPPVNSQWYDFDCGTIDITPYTGTMLDYASNTKIQIMLPFIGSSALDTDEVMNRTLGLKYRIDLLSGACVAMLTINGDVHYQWTGECAVNIPFSASDFSRVYGAVLGAVGAGVTGFMAAGAAGVASQAAASAATTQAMNNNIAASKAFKDAIGDVVKGSRGAPAMREKLKQASIQTMDKAIAEAGSNNRIAGSIKAAQIARTVNNVVGQVMSAKGGVAHSGTISGAAGMLGVRTPYVIIEYPNQSLPENYRHFVGYPSNITARLGDLTGYTECEQLIANGITGTDSEYTELVEALKGGVYL